MGGFFASALWRLPVSAGHLLAVVSDSPIPHRFPFLWGTLKALLHKGFRYFIGDNSPIPPLIHTTKKAATTAQDGQKIGLHQRWEA